MNTTVLFHGPQTLKTKSPLHRVVRNSGVRPFTDDSGEKYRTSLVKATEPKFALERSLLRFFTRHKSLFSSIECFVTLVTASSLFALMAGWALPRASAITWLVPISAILMCSFMSLLYLIRFGELEIRFWQPVEVYPWSENLPCHVKLTLQKIWCHIQKSGLKGIGFRIDGLVSDKVRDPLFVVYRKDTETGEIKEEYCCEAWDTPFGFSNILRREA